MSDKPYRSQTIKIGRIKAANKPKKLASAKSTKAAPMPMPQPAPEVRPEPVAPPVQPRPEPMQHKPVFADEVASSSNACQQVNDSRDLLNKILENSAQNQQPEPIQEEVRKPAPTHVFKKHAVVNSRPKSNAGKQAFMICGALVLSVITAFQMYSGSGQQEYAGWSAKELIGVQPAGSMRRNPEISWLEQFLCSGRKRSPGCSGEIYHPYVQWWEDHGDEVPTDVQKQHIKGMLTTFDKGPDKVEKSQYFRHDKFK